MLYDIALLMFIGIILFYCYEYNVSCVRIFVNSFVLYYCNVYKLLIKRFLKCYYIVTKIYQIITGLYYFTLYSLIVHDYNCNYDYII